MSQYREDVHPGGVDLPVAPEDVMVALHHPSLAPTPAAYVAALLRPASLALLGAEIDPRFFRGRPSLGRCRPVGPHRQQGIARVEWRSTGLGLGFTPAPGQVKVGFHDVAVLLVAGIEPAANGLGRKAAVGEGAHVHSSRSQYSSHLAEHRNRPYEVVDRYAAHRGVEGGIDEGESRIHIEIVNNGG